MSDEKAKVEMLFREMTLVGIGFESKMADRAMAIMNEAAIAKAEAIVEAIVKDLAGRSGFDWIWDSLDEEIRKEVIETWYRMTVQELGG